jgi:hypothetical protein
MVLSAIKLLKDEKMNQIENKEIKNEDEEGASFPGYKWEEEILCKSPYQLEEAMEREFGEQRGEGNDLFKEGFRYDQGEDVAVDQRQALFLYSQASQMGHAEAAYRIGILYYKGQELFQDDEEAAKWFRRAAERGHRDAAINLGWMYGNGRGVPQNDEEAVTWFRRAAEMSEGNETEMKEDLVVERHKKN